VAAEAFSPFKQEYIQAPLATRSTAVAEILLRKPLLGSGQPLLGRCQIPPAGTKRLQLGIAAGG
jgi:hypothetical protein